MCFPYSFTPNSYLKLFVALCDSEMWFIFVTNGKRGKVHGVGRSEHGALKIHLNPIWICWESFSTPQGFEKFS